MARRFLLVLLLFLVGCSPAAPTPTPPAPPSPTPPPAESQPEPPRSDVTWEILHLPSGTPMLGGAVHLAPPYEFEVRFSGPVDRASVEAAITRQVGHGRIDIQGWREPHALRLTVAGVSPGGGAISAGALPPQVAIDPSGGTDPQGTPLRVAPERFNFAAFTFWPAEPTALLALDPATGRLETVARFPQPYQTVSRSPDGRRLLLRRHILTPGQSVGITGDAWVYDLAARTTTPLQVGGLYWHQWSRDGGLLLWGGCAESPRCAVWAPPDGPVRRVLLYGPGKDRYVTSATISPDGRRAAVFARSVYDRADLLIFDLTRSGETVHRRTVAGAAGVTQGPSGLTWVPAAWAPDGSVLAYGHAGGRLREEWQPMGVYLTGVDDSPPVRIAETNSGRIGSWSPQGDRLFLWGTGVVDRTGRVLVKDAETWPVWAPDGRLYQAGKVYDRSGQVVWTTIASTKAHWSPDGRTIALVGVVNDPTLPELTGGLYRVGGDRIATGLQGDEGLAFSPDGRWAYLPGPDRVVDTVTGREFRPALPAARIQGLGEYKVLAVTNDGRLLLALGSTWEW